MSKSSSFRTIDASPILLSDGLSLDIDFVADAVERLNGQFQRLKVETQSMKLNVFEVMDFRMLSGLVGDALVTVMARERPRLLRSHGSHLSPPTAATAQHPPTLVKNPHIDGYPDLLNASRSAYRKDIDDWKANDFGKFLKYPHGGVEVKNTFGTKKAKAYLASSETRIEKINRMLEWKAHHRYTNNLLALFSDYVDRCPQVVAVMYCDRLTESDWKKKQNPVGLSAMTSFCVTEPSGWEKIRAGIKLCRADNRYLSFFGLPLLA